MAKDGLKSLGLKPQHTFEELVVGSNNQMAAKACLEVSKNPGEAYNPLCLIGDPGVGKTHLMQAVAHVMLKNDPDIKVLYTSAERFMNDIISAIGDDNIIAVRGRYSSLDLWLVDDIQFLLESKSAQAEFLHIFNNLHENNSQIIVALDRPPSKLKGLDKNLVSRLDWGVTTQIKMPDVKSRMEILELKQKKYGLDMSSKMLQYAAGMIRSNVRELEGFLKKINAYLTLSHQELNLDLITHVLQEVLPEGMAEMKPEEVPEQVLSTPATEVPEEMPQAKVENGPATTVSLQGKSTGRSSQKRSAAAAPKEPAQPLEVVMPDSKKKSKKEEPPVKEKTPDPPKGKDVKPVEPEPAKKGKPAPPPEPEPKQEEPAAGEEDDEVLDEDDVDFQPNHKEIGAVFFYPMGSEEELKTVHKKFQDVIKKHKLKFRLKQAASEAYDCANKVNYSAFVEVCKKNKVPVAIVIGPPPTAFIPEQDFYDLLSVTLDVQGISLQLVNWTEINKDYRYLNLALDIALVRSR